MVKLLSEHISLVALMIIIIREVQQHAPQYRYCKLSYHAHKHNSRPMNTQPAECRRAALLGLYRTVEMERVGDGSGTIFGIYIGVCVCVCACDCSVHTWEV